MTSPETIEAVTSARFRPVELTDGCWAGARRINGWTPTGPEYQEQLGPVSAITLEFGDLVDVEPWLLIATTSRGEYDHRDAGNGYVQVFTNDTTPEEKARSAVHSAVAFSNVARRLIAGDGDPDDWVSDQEETAIKEAEAETIQVTLDGQSIDFCLLRAAGGTAASATISDRTITLSGCFEPTRVKLRSVADIAVYLTTGPRTDDPSGPTDSG